MVSVIIPFLDVEKYLRESIESVISQSYGDIEIVMVNDGSVDSSLRIAREYAKKDKRIFLVDKKRGGVSSARNTGIELIKGSKIRSLIEKGKDSESFEIKSQNEVVINEASIYDISEFPEGNLEGVERYINFTDSDDTLSKDALKDSMELGERLNLDIVAFKMRHFHDGIRPPPPIRL